MLDLITQQIIPWLPIKSLTRCKVISKHWYSTISSPNFIFKHTKQPLFSHSVPPVETLLIQSGNNLYLYSCDVDDNVARNHSHNERNSLIKLNSIGDMFDCGDDIVVDLVGCSNGLVCLGEPFGEFFILWNPNTNESHEYYPEQIEAHEVVTTCLKPGICWGFGHVSSLDDYMVIRVLPVEDVDFGSCVCLVDVYSLRTNTFNRMEVGAPQIWGEKPRLVNDTFYWIARGMEIVGYDLVRDTIVTYPHLTLALGCPSSDDFLCVMGGCLTIYTRNSQNERVLNIVKTSSSSGRVLSIIPCEEQHFSDLFGFTKSGNMFFALQLQDSESAMLGLFDPTHNVKQSLIHFVACERIHVAPYNSTQISPFPPPELPPIASVQVP